MSTQTVHPKVMSSQRISSSAFCQKEKVPLIDIEEIFITRFLNWTAKVVNISLFFMDHVIIYVGICKNTKYPTVIST